MPNRLASCSCGQLTARAVGEPVRVSICHCLACQRRTGSVFGEQARFRRDNVSLSGESTVYSASVMRARALNFTSVGVEDQRFTMKRKGRRSTWQFLSERSPIQPFHRRASRSMDHESIAGLSLRPMQSTFHEWASRSLLPAVRLGGRCVTTAHQFRAAAERVS